MFKSSTERDNLRTSDGEKHWVHAFIDASLEEDTAFDAEAYERMVRTKDEQHRKRYAHSYRQMAEINQRRYEERMRKDIAPPSPDEEGRR